MEYYKIYFVLQSSKIHKCVCANTSLPPRFIRERNEIDIVFEDDQLSIFFQNLSKFFSDNLQLLDFILCMPSFSIFPFNAVCKVVLF